MRSRRKLHSSLALLDKEKKKITAQFNFYPIKSTVCSEICASINAQVMTFVPDSCTDKTVGGSGVLVCKGSPAKTKQISEEHAVATAISLFNIISLLKRHPPLAL